MLLLVVLVLISGTNVSYFFDFGDGREDVISQYNISTEWNASVAGNIRFFNKVLSW